MSQSYLSTTAKKSFPSSISVQSVPSGKNSKKTPLPLKGSMFVREAKNGYKWFALLQAWYSERQNNL